MGIRATIRRRRRLKSPYYIFWVLQQRFSHYNRGLPILTKVSHYNKCLVTTIKKTEPSPY